MLHIFLTNFCDIIPIRVELIKYGGNFISISLLIDDIALLVCIVLITKCPVEAALIAILAVSTSLISPIIIISGSCLSMDLRPTSNVKPILSFTCI